MPKTVILLSGGIDSSTLLYYLYSQEHQLYPLFMFYGQRHHREIESAKAIARTLELELTSLDISGIGPALVGSSLTSDIEVPEGHYTDPTMAVTTVNNRNMILMSIAAAYALTRKCDYVAYAAHSGDHFIYADCRPEFVKSLRKTIKLATGVGVITPFVNISKVAIVRTGLELQVPYELTSSCYNGREKACGRCGTCIERLESFEMAGAVDPILYE